MADLIKYAFVGGEIAPTLFGRSDLEKYDFAVALARNWFVDYHGGMSTRSGMPFIDFVKTPTEDTKFVPFRFAPSLAQTYVVLFGHQYIRFVQDKDYVLEATKAITSIDPVGADSVVTTAAPHGYTTGDWVRLTDIGPNLTTFFEDRTFQIVVTGANTFALFDPKTGASPGIIPATLVTGNAARIYTIVSPYDGDDLSELVAHQSRNVIYLTHPDFAPRKLTRTSHLSWAITTESFVASIDHPTGGVLTVTGGTGANYGVGFIVTAVNSDGEESVASDMLISTNIADYSQAVGQAKLTWTPVTGAVEYRVYRTIIILTGADMNRSMQVGFVGRSFAPIFIDNNITPDFTITPPDHYNPFATGAIRAVDVTAGGAGYANTDTVGDSGNPGTGLIAYPITLAGAITGLLVKDSGSGYTSPVVLTVTTGAGATFNVTLSAATGTYPRTNSTFQQRKVYAGSNEEPLTLWASKPTLYNNFDSAPIIQQDDSYQFELDSPDVSPIKHLLATRSGLVIMSMAGIWQLTGGNERAVTPTNALADPQTYTGVSDLPPLPIDTDVLFQEAKGGSVRLLTYNDFSKLFASQDLSILANHLTDPQFTFNSWSYASDPNHTVYAARSDGTLVCLTIVKEQNVFGWSHFTTQGYYRDTICVQEDNVDVTYFVVERKLGGYWVKTLEYEDRRTVSLPESYAEDAFCVDCGLRLPATLGAGSITPSAVTGDAVTITATGATPFVSGDVGKIIRAGGGKAAITGYTSSTIVTVRVLRPFTELIPETITPGTYSFWTIDDPVGSLSGLWHLEGMTVRILADGNVLAEQVVSGGTVDLGSYEVTRAAVGLPYDCVAQTLPPTASTVVIENKPKAPKTIYARVYNSRGLRFGADLDHLYSLEEKASAVLGEPKPLINGMKQTSINASFDLEGQFYIVQSYPLPATILSAIPEMDIPSAQRK